jgi:LuxR family maltose regulon positive regulatory protein
VPEVKNGCSRARPAAAQAASEIPPPDDAPPIPDYLPLTRAHARLLLAQGKRAEAADQLAGLYETSASLGWQSCLPQVRAVQALAAAASDDALGLLAEALALAEPENYVRSFLDTGKPMEEFLSWSLESPALSDPHLRAYVSRLLTHFVADLPSKSSQPSDSTLIEQITERELEILQLIAQGLSNREISKRLFLALSTVKGYNRIIFDKLQVQRRTEAVARARQLGLL